MILQRHLLPLGLVAAAGACPSLLQAANAEERPNIILILVDDMGYSDLGIYGSEIETPNLDRLAQEGIRFREFYNNSISAPTRASLITGQYSHCAGIGYFNVNLGQPGYQGFLNRESLTFGEVLREAENLVKGGVKELLVISQDTAAYGLDVKYRMGFAGGRPVKTRLLELARELGKLDAWVRLHYVYPYPSTDAVVELMAEGLILPYLDVPFQHAHPRVLKAMKRPASAEKNLERIAAWRAVCPDITIRSTFITGFPGETEEEFEYLLDFLREARLDRVGCFAYSPVEGAQANALPGQLPDEVREDRRRRFMEVQAEISSEILRQKVGSVRRVIIDEPEDEDGVAVGRTTADAPDIDGVVYVTTDKHLNPGDFVDVRITDSREHDLIGRHVVSE